MVFEDRLDKPSASTSSKAPKRKKVEWEGDDVTAANTATNRGAGKAAAATAGKGGQQPGKRRKADAASLHPPPPFPVVSPSTYPAPPSVSSSTSLSAFSVELSAFVQAVSSAESAALHETYGEVDSASEHAFLSKYGRLALDGWSMSGHSTADAPKRGGGGSGKGRASTAPSDTADPDTALSLYAHLASALSSTVEQYAAHAASLTSASASAPSLSPSLPPSVTAFLSGAAASSSNSPLSSLIRQGYSALSVNSDVLIAELRQMRDELDKRREWREGVSARINSKVLGNANADDEDEDEDDAATASGKKKKEVKRLIKSITKDDA